MAYNLPLKVVKLSTENISSDRKSIYLIFAGKALISLGFVYHQLFACEGKTALERGRYRLQSSRFILTDYIR